MHLALLVFTSYPILPYPIRSLPLTVEEASGDPKYNLSRRHPLLDTLLVPVIVF